MSNRGLRAIDPSTDIGSLRLQVGDTNFTEFDPVEDDYVNYDYFSDSTLEAFIESADENITRATGFAYRSLAGILTMSAVSITTDDLRVDTLGRAKLMRELANEWISQAADEDEAAASDIFDVIPFAGAKKAVNPELAPPVNNDAGDDPNWDNWTVNEDGYLVNG